VPNLRQIRYPNSSIFHFFEEKMSHTKVCIHYVWTTKNRTHLLTSTLRKELFGHIRLNAYAKKIHIDRINGYTEHVHCLVWLKPEQTIGGIMKLLKGESAYWFNNSQHGKKQRLEWQDDYFAVSVSQSLVDIVRTYIDNQESHHKNHTFEEEYNEFMKRFFPGEE
jgi:putative transposase